MYFSVEFDLPGFDSVGQDIADCPTHGIISQEGGNNEETDGPTSEGASGHAGQSTDTSSNSGHIVTQATDETRSPTFSFTSRKFDGDHTDAVQETAIETVERKVKSLSDQKQILMLGMLIDDLKSKKCELDLNKVTGHVKISYPAACKAPEYTLGITSASSCISPKEEVERFCAMIDDIKLNRYPSGVVLDRSEVRPGFGKYREGKEYSIADIVLGEGLNAKVCVTFDNLTKKSHAKKEVRINIICSDEIRAMTDLNDSGITPRLFLCQLNQDKVELYMEIVDNSVTTEEVLKQMTSIKYRTSDVENIPKDIRDIRLFALHVCSETFKAVQHLHQFGWFHRDLHGGNVLLQHVCEGEVKVRILDLGKAAHVAVLREHKDPTQLSKALADDVTNILRQFTSLYLVDDLFEDIFDFKLNHVERIREIPESHLEEEQKAFLISIIQKGLKVKIMQQIDDFISDLDKKLQRNSAVCLTTSVQRVVGMLEFEHSPANGYQDLHVDEHAVSMAGSRDVPAMNMDPFVSQLQKIHLVSSN